MPAASAIALAAAAALAAWWLRGSQAPQEAAPALSAPAPSAKAPEPARGAPGCRDSVIDTDTQTSCPDADQQIDVGHPPSQYLCKCKR